VISLVVLMYVCFPLSLRNVEDLLFERGIDICHEAVRRWWNRSSPLFAGDIRGQPSEPHVRFHHGRWHLDEMYNSRSRWVAGTTSGELAPVVPTTRARDAAVQADEEPAEVRLRARQRPQPLLP
jgi:hypothetical protein